MHVDVGKSHDVHPTCPCCLDGGCRGGGDPVITCPHSGRAELGEAREVRV